MPILSIEFIVFFMGLFPLYWLFHRLPKLQNWLLIFTNLVLLTYISQCFAISVFCYSIAMAIIGSGIRNSERTINKKIFLTIGIVFAVSLLGFFKYLDFFKPFFYQCGLEILADIFIPLGMSYYVFQSIALLVSIYKGTSEHLRWHEILLHFSFFLTITAGPIIRSDSFKSIDGVNIGIAKQIHNKRQLLNIDLALCLILLGTAKTLWLSAYIGTNFVEPVFNSPLQYNTSEILLAVYGYTFQLFFNFSGYSELVIGFALLLGFTLPCNFKAPLYAKNLKDFWERWHISLSTWIRDYIYIPLGGSRKGFFLTQVNIIIAFVLSGIWHGDSWNFAIWGALHSIALIVLNVKAKIFACGPSKYEAMNKFKNHLGIFITFNFVCFSFVIFKITELNDIKDFFMALWNSPLSDDINDLLPIAIIFLIVFCYPLWTDIFHSFVKLLQNMPMLIKAIVIVIVLQVIIELSPAGIPSFIYASF